MEADRKLIFFARGDVGSDSRSAGEEASDPGWVSFEGESTGFPDGVGGGGKE